MSGKDFTGVRRLIGFASSFETLKDAKRMTPEEARNTADFLIKNIAMVGTSDTITAVADALISASAEQLKVNHLRDEIDRLQREVIHLRDQLTFAEKWKKEYELRIDTATLVLKPDEYEK